MGVDIKSLKNRIKSVDSTLHLTKAMGLVASAKIRGASIAMNKSREYANALDDTVSLLSSAKSCERSEYMKHGKEGKICLIAIAGDRGLAGGYNSNLFKMVEAQNAEKIIPIGKRACDRYGAEQVKTETFSYADAIVLSKELCEEFKSGMYEKIGIVYTKYVSMMSQNPQIEWVLPLSKTERKSKADIIYEPDERTVLETVMEEYIAGKIVAAAKESFTCEVVARRFAMDNAGKNAGEMIDGLKLEYNRARQGAITQEITEIVAGSGM
ncbi:MAG: ATP synthase F1 subunit gamma [Ruminococcaceae bacterium]|nr:ATP synthase F1 subunit gamma [Oscillospiraceae bacterium]